jgi:hypothetical protein
MIETVYPSIIKFTESDILLQLIKSDILDSREIFGDRNFANLQKSCQNKN